MLIERYRPGSSTSSSASAAPPPGAPVSAEGWAALLDLVTRGQVRLTVTTAAGGEAVVIAAADLADLQRRADRVGSRADTVVLTPRERQVLERIGEGDSTAEAAAHLGLAVSTVTAHLATARRKYGVRSSAEAAARARADPRPA